MAKADPAVVAEFLVAARAAVADPELRARLVPEAVDDVETSLLKLRTALLQKLPDLQRLLLGAHAARARELGAPVASTADRDAAISALRAAAEAYCADRAAIDAFFAPAVVDRLSDSDVASLRQELEKLSAAQRKDIELLLEMDRRAEARAAEQGQRRADQETASEARAARFEEMRARLDARMEELKASQARRKAR